MRQLKLFSIFALLLSCSLVSPALFAQSVCDAGNGPLDSARQANISTDDIIQKFTANESLFKSAREKYSFTQTIDVQELSRDGQDIAGEYNQVRLLKFH